MRKSRKLKQSRAGQTPNCKSALGMIWFELESNLSSERGFVRYSAQEWLGNGAGNEHQELWHSWLGQLSPRQGELVAVALQGAKPSLLCVCRKNQQQGVPECFANQSERRGSS